MSKYPEACPLVVCGECADLHGEDFVVELTSVDPIVFVCGVDGYSGETTVEFRGWDVATGERHDVLDPRPLTRAAREMLAIIVEKSNVG